MRKLGRKRNFRRTGYYIPPDVFDSLRPYEHNVLRLKMRGADNEDIADRLKIKKTTISSYLAQLRASIRRCAGVTITSDEQFMRFYQEYLKRTGKR